MRLPDGPRTGPQSRRASPGRVPAAWPDATDREAARRLWKVSEQMTGVRCLD
jgi:hypothetical protein